MLDSLNKDDTVETIPQNVLVEVNSWVVVEYSTKKTVKHYIGQIISINNNKESEIKFARKYKSDKFLWPEIEDCDIVPISQIKRVVNAPKVGRRNELYFNLNLSLFNMQ
jgi:hypothetical protein